MTTKLQHKQENLTNRIIEYSKILQYDRRRNIPQKVKWDTPNGEMGHPKRRNGIPQMAKWDIQKRRFGASGHGYNEVK